MRRITMNMFRKMSLKNESCFSIRTISISIIFSISTITP